MPETQGENPAALLDHEQETDTSAGGEIDAQALAAKVYELLKEEAKLERERRGWRRP